MGARKIAKVMNARLKKRGETYKTGKNIGKPLTVGKTMITDHLKTIFGNPRKIKKVFYLDDKKKRERLEFCQKILKKQIKGENIFFIDETKLDLSPFTYDYIRITREDQERLKKGDPSIANLINRPEHKFEKSIMIAGGISCFCLSNLMLLKGNMNDFQYAQALLNYKEDIDELNKKYNCNLIFEQDGASAHTSKNNKNLIKNFFNDNYIQNPPNSPDLAYPIENLWAYLKKKNYEQISKRYRRIKKIYN